MGCDQLRLAEHQLAPLLAECSEATTGTTAPERSDNTPCPRAQLSSRLLNPTPRPRPLQLDEERDREEAQLRLAFQLQAEEDEAVHTPTHPGIELRANIWSISHRCHSLEVAFVWELTKETIHLPLGCLQGG